MDLTGSLLLLLFCLWGIYTLNRHRAFDEAFRRMVDRPEPIRRYYAGWLDAARRDVRPAPMGQPQQPPAAEIRGFDVLLAYLLTLSPSQRERIIEALARARTGVAARH